MIKNRSLLLNTRIILLLNLVLISLLLAKNQLPERILTPAEKNRKVAQIKGKIVTEYDVFGPFKIENTPKYLSKEQREEKISKYLLTEILADEGLKHGYDSLLNFDQTKRFLLEKEAVLKLYDDLFIHSVINDQEIENYYQNNQSFFLKDYQDSKELILTVLKKEKEQEISKEVGFYLDSLKKAYQVAYNEDLFRMVASINLPTQDLLMDSLKKIDQSYYNQNLISYNKQIVRFKDLVEAIKNLPPFAVFNTRKISFLKTITEGPIINKILLEEAKKRGFLENKEVISRALKKLRPYIAKMYGKHLFVESKYLPTNDEMVNYYLEHKRDPELMSEKKVRVYEIFIPFDKENLKQSKMKAIIKLENFLKDIKEGDDFFKYAKFYHRDFSFDGDLGYIFENDFGKVSKQAVTMQAGDISEVIIQPYAASIIKVTEVFEPRLYIYEQVVDLIRRKIITKKQTAAQEKFKIDKFKEYNVVIY